MTGAGECRLACRHWQEGREHHDRMPHSRRVLVQIGMEGAS